MVAIPKKPRKVKDTNAFKLCLSSESPSLENFMFVVWAKLYHTPYWQWVWTDLLWTILISVISKMWGNWWKFSLIVFKAQREIRSPVLSEFSTFTKRESRRFSLLFFRCFSLLAMARRFFQDFPRLFSGTVHFLSGSELQDNSLGGSWTALWMLGLSPRGAERDWATKPHPTEGLGITEGLSEFAISSEQREV